MSQDTFRRSDGGRFCANADGSAGERQGAGRLRATVPAASAAAPPPGPERSRLVKEMHELER